ncbi:hypothetical protein PIB30_004007 [Stylosanthes scabra]|uniref:Uncharacterized protein n=1 Tax=Stylosanthes scabra TaxID=79078 RepID=A0ABU6X0Y9_9FABA|nr:hypothetical protein [Stylosanthes scabra]
MECVAVACIQNPSSLVTHIPCSMFSESVGLHRYAQDPPSICEISSKVVARALATSRWKDGGLYRKPHHPRLLQCPLQTLKNSMVPTTISTSRWTSIHDELPAILSGGLWSTMAPPCTFIIGDYEGDAADAPRDNERCRWGALVMFLLKFYAVSRFEKASAYTGETGKKEASEEK